MAGRVLVFRICRAGHRQPHEQIRWAGSNSGSARSKASFAKLLQPQRKDPANAPPAAASDALPKPGLTPVGTKHECAQRVARARVHVPCLQQIGCATRIR